MQRQFFNSDRGLTGNIAGRFGAVLAMAGLLLLSACDTSNKDITQNAPAEPSGLDGIPPTLTVVSIRESTKSAKPVGTVEPGKVTRIDITASEALAAPVVFINGEPATVNGKVTGWTATREMTMDDPLGEVTFTIDYQDISGEVGQMVSDTTDGSTLVLCVDDCPEPVNLAGDWRLDTEGGAGVGPAPGDISWWSTDIDGVVETRACWFDDVYRFGADGSFLNILGDETWLEDWQAGAEQCGPPLAPHDGSAAGTWVYDEGAGTLTIGGVGSYIGLPRTVNGGELPNVPVPDSIVYDVLSLDGDSLTVTIDVGGGSWWTYKLARQPLSPLAGKWRLNKESGAGVGPNEGDISWWSTDIDGVVETRSCWFDDIYEFGADGSFANILGDETWLETWQGVPAEACGAPVAPHDGSNGAIYQYDEDASTLKLTGVGAHIGLPRTVNGAELGAPGEAPESVTYNVTVLDGDDMTVTIDVGTGWWQYRLERVSNSPVVGKWTLATEGGAGVGPAAGDTSWWSTDIDGVVEARACWFDDIYHFGGDGSFQNYLGDETWLEDWQAGAEQCGAPLAPHDGSTAGTWDYDADGGTLTLNGQGLHIGLPRTVNGGELPNVPVPDSVTYDVLSQDGDSLQVAIDVGGGTWWTYTLARVNDTAALAGKWRLDTETGAGVGPAAGDTSWWSTDIDGVVEARACWFDDFVEFGPDGSFANEQGDETWLETWQGVGAESCGAPVAPHDGSARAIFAYDDAAGTITVIGTGAHLGLPRTVNGADLTTPAEAPDSVTYDVLTLDGDNITVTLETAPGNWWTYKYVRVSNSPWVGNWKLATEGGAGVGPAPGDTQWWSTDIDGVVEARACWFDDVFHFGAGGNFQNFQDGETWLEDWQAGAEQCGAPLAPHDGSAPGVWRNDNAAGTLTISGVGSHVGLPRTVNGGELPNVPVPESVIYDVLSFDLGTTVLTIDVGGGNWWTYTLERE
ncbi:MAG: hypothetical protein QNJ23_00835 [Woeseiaceae bacterium]|nr:hypothetical protein [Woeseiaceae bacterium]